MRFMLPILLLLSACSGGDRNVNVREALRDSARSSSTIIFTEPQPVDSSDVVYYPLLFQRKEIGVGLSSSYEGERSVYWNLLFVNTSTGARHLLSEDRKIIIWQVHSGSGVSGSYQGSNSKILAGKRWILYDVFANDYNGDGMPDAKDPASLFVSDREGYGFRQVSPEGWGVVSWRVAERSGKLLLLARRDDNGDRRIDDGDKSVPFLVDLDAGGAARQLFQEDYIDTLHGSLRRIWKQ
ncbi:MAG: hypothetical protein EOO16_19560 [Chitinophagaceae bacterium]|nr:MAG: hypothetical protein EOO16_19560 [Chitinophagaceae bacterium]